MKAGGAVSDASSISHSLDTTGWNLKDATITHSNSVLKMSVQPMKFSPSVSELLIVMMSKNKTRSALQLESNAILRGWTTITVTFSVENILKVA